MKPPAKCGTTSGRQRHLRLGEPVCAPCQTAYTGYLREWKARKSLSGVSLSKPCPAPAARILDAAVAKVGADFPALGALIHSGWTASA